MFVCMAWSGRLLDESLRESDLTHDQAWRIQGYKNAASFSRALSGERPLDMHKLERLPWAVAARFWSKWIAAKADEHGTELRADRLRMAKVNHVNDERKVG